MAPFFIIGIMLLMGERRGGRIVLIMPFNLWAYFIIFRITALCRTAYWQRDALLQFWQLDCHTASIGTHGNFK